MILLCACELVGILGLLGEAQSQSLIETFMDFIDFYIEKFSKRALELPPHFGAFQTPTTTGEAFARRLSTQMRFRYAQMNSRTAPVDANAFSL